MPGEKILPSNIYSLVTILKWSSTRGKTRLELITNLTVISSTDQTQSIMQRSSCHKKLKNNNYTYILYLKLSFYSNTQVLSQQVHAKQIKEVLLLLLLSVVLHDCDCTACMCNIQVQFISHSVIIINVI